VGWDLISREPSTFNPPVMSSFPVVAEVTSKLHADIALIRLFRAGIPASRVSAVFPRVRAPNSVCCCLTNFRRIPMRAALPVAAAGLLARLFGRDCHSVNFRKQVQKLGFTSEMTARLIEKVEEGTIVLCVHAHNEAEAAVAWHIFHHVSAENIMCPADHEDRKARDAGVLTPQFAGLAA
jgi:hypothetical protein